jgi:hypothetical protein
VGWFTNLLSPALCPAICPKRLGSGVITWHLGAWDGVALRVGTARTTQGAPQSGRYGPENRRERFTRACEVRTARARCLLQQTCREAAAREVCWAGGFEYKTRSDQISEKIARPARATKFTGGGASSQSRAEGQGGTAEFKGVKPAYQAGNYRGLEAPGGGGACFPLWRQPPLRDCQCR